VNIYIAAPYPLRPVAITVMHDLEAAGHRVTSSWLRTGCQDDDCTLTARRDLEDIDVADALLVLQPDDWHDKGTGGRHIEFGYALAKGKQLIVFGEPSTNFHHLPHVRVIRHLEDL
jgi:nucleoside 2-deoxyribosyltransferase